MLTPHDALAVLASAHPFWAGIALRLDLRESSHVPTAGTDGRVVYVNPTFWASLASDAERVGVYVHEVAHVLFGHPWRRGNRDAHTWNLAADLHCNALVLSLSWAKLPAHGMDPRAVAASWGLTLDALVDMSTEELYERLGAERNGEHGDGECTCSLSDSPEADTALGEAEHAATRAAVIAAASQSRGDVPGALVPWVARLAAPVPVDWRAALRAYMSERVPCDYTWRRPARRWAPLGLYLPALDSEDALSHVVLAVDTSGSIGEERIAAMLAACLDCARSVSARRVTLVLWETQVYAEHDLTHAGELPTLSVQQGGTDVRTVFEHLTGAQPAVLVVLTDLETPFPEHAPAYPVLWLTTATDTARAPWGRVLVAGAP